MNKILNAINEFNSYLKNNKENNELLIITDEKDDLTIFISDYFKDYNIKVNKLDLFNEIIFNNNNKIKIGLILEKGKHFGKSCEVFKF